MAAMETQLRADAPETTIDTRMRAAETMRSLRKLARNKPLVQSLLAAFEQHAFDREDVMHVVNLTDAEYDTAHRQLTRLVDQLPSRLKPRSSRRKRSTMYGS